MKNLTFLPAKDYFASTSVMVLPSGVATDNTDALDFVRRTEGQLASAAEYGFPKGDAKNNTIRRICSTLGQPFKLPEDIEHPEATMSLLADLVTVGAMKTCKDEDGSTAYHWIPAIETKWGHCRYTFNASNNVPRLSHEVRISRSLASRHAPFIQSLSPRLLRCFFGSMTDVHVCYIPDLEGQLQSLNKGKRPDHKAWDEVEQTEAGILSTNWGRTVAKSLGTNRPSGIAIDRHVFVTDSPYRLAEVLNEALPCEGSLGRYWYTPKDGTLRFVPPKASDRAGKKASKLEAILAA